MTKSTITRDELNEVIATYGKHHMAHRMAIVLLAAMDSEPVAYAVSNDFWNQGNHKQHIDGKQCDLFFPGDVSHGEKFEPDDYDYVFPLYRHAQQPVVPATLPCSVELKPGLIIGKGCKTETLLTALRRRADYNADIDAMTPEERAEHDASIKAFKAMLPAAPQELK